MRWVRYHPVLGGLGALAALLGLVLTLALLSIWQGDREQQQAALETNGFIANSQAGALLFELREFADRIERCGQRPAIQTLLAHGETTRDPSVPGECGRGFKQVVLFGNDGRLLAQWPTPEAPIWGRNYAFRGYFRGARDLAERHLRGAFLGPAYRTESDAQLHFAFAAPAYGANGDCLGVVAGSLAVASTLGQVGMSDKGGGGHVVALLGPRDHDRETPHSPRLDFIIHPQLKQGREVAVVDPTQAMLHLAMPAMAGEQFALRWTAPLLLPDYQDPLLSSHGLNLAAFAPVGQTGYVVAIQTPKSAVLSSGRALAAQLALRAGLHFAIGLGLLGAFAFSTARRRRTLERFPAA